MHGSRCRLLACCRHWVRKQIHLPSSEGGPVSDSRPARSSRSSFFRALPPLGILAAGIASFLAISAAFKEQPSRGKPAERVPTAQVASVRGHAGGMTRGVDGTLVPYREIKIAAEVGGRIEKREAVCHAGNYVEAGQLLAVIDSRDYQREYDRLESEVRQAKVALAELEEEVRGAENLIKIATEDLKLRTREFNRLQKLQEKSAVSVSELEKAEQAKLAAENTLTTLRNHTRLLNVGRARFNSALELAIVKRSKAKLDLERTEIRAPAADVTACFRAEDPADTPPKASHVNSQQHYGKRLFDVTIGAVRGLVSSLFSERYSATMFDSLQTAPPDAILGLTEAYRNDPNPLKINLSVGVYKNAEGNTPILGVVKEAEKRLLAEETGKSYLPMDGLPAYGERVRELLFAADHELANSKRAITVQTPGGTGALRVTADFLKQKLSCDRIWCSNPTWANHPGVFKAAGLDVESYPYIDDAGTGLDFDAMCSAIDSIPAGDAICLHACCHNPTGIDLTVPQWEQIGQVLAQRQVLPVVDFAYQGFARGLDDDAAGLRQLLATIPEALICSSFSKNFGLYNERVGALTLVARSPEEAQAALSHIKLCVRTNYSNPPKHGAAIVAAVLSDPSLRHQWTEEVAAMRDRIAGMRNLFAHTMRDKGVQRDFSFITSQRGMFSFSGLSPEQVDRLREEYSIYIVRSGRINVAGMSEANMDRLCDAIDAVL